MSGRKVSRIMLDHAVRNAVRLRTEAEDARTRARSILTTLGSKAGEAGALKTGLADLRRRWEEVEQQWPGTKRLWTVSDAEQRAAQCRALGRELKTIARDASALSGAADVRGALAALNAEVEARDAELRPWLGDRWEDYVGRVRARLATLDRAIRSGGDAAPDRATGERLSAELDELLKQVAADRREAAERDHVASAIEQVCREKGYAATRHPLEVPGDDLVLDVDTYSHGRIQVRLELGSFTPGAVERGSPESGGITWRSESAGLSQEDCAKTFPDIAEKLRRLGVGADFSYEENGRPIGQTHTAATLSQGTPAAVTVERGT
ncbi:MAG: hypothetical protein OXH69_10595 [Acidobacteria bacterium]|nr:hypothetical protein [Acidobacteriota bacterium]